MISLGFSEIPLVEEFGQEMRQKEEATGRIPLKNPQKPPQKQPYFGQEVRQKKKAIGKIPHRKTPSKTALFWLRSAPEEKGNREDTPQKNPLKNSPILAQKCTERRRRAKGRNNDALGGVS
ncbi:MAG: hypothetical protein QXZ09_05865 [Candidatus Methanomethylicaceae archaeon]